MPLGVFTRTLSDKQNDNIRDLVCNVRGIQTVRYYFFTIVQKGERYTTYTTRHDETRSIFYYFLSNSTILPEQSG